MMTVSQREAAELIESSDIKFVRLAFCDVFGVQKNISIQASEIGRAFEQGIALRPVSVPRPRNDDAPAVETLQRRRRALFLRDPQPGRHAVFCGLPPLFSRYRAASRRA